MAKKKTTELRIPAPRQRVVEIKIKSLPGSSLITNSLKGANEVHCVDLGVAEHEASKKAGGKVAKKKRKARDPEKEFQKSIYYMPNGKDYGLPASGFRKSMLQVGINLKKAGRSSVDGTDITRNVWVDSDGGGNVQIKTKKPRMREDIVRDSGATRAPRLRYRAEFDEWSAALRLRYNPEMFTAEEVVNLLAYAGATDGYGEKRIGKGYEHGGYVIDKVVGDKEVL